jgi:acylphosphatase
MPRMTAPDRIRIHVVVKGRVQGVGFRWFTRSAAKRCGVVGWVRNLPDRSVEAVGEAERDAITAWTNELRNGPPLAHVTELIAHEEPCEPEGQPGLGAFDIR